MADPTKHPLLPETTYHIYNHANGSENLFRTRENYFYFLKKYGEYIHPIAETYAYCLMPNHFHLMVNIRSEEELITFFKKAGKLSDDGGFEDLSVLISKQFGNLFNAYSKAYNKMYQRKGSLFQHKFRRKPVENDAYFSQLVAYIHNNPVHHGFCKELLDWKYSSYQTYYWEHKTKLSRKEVFEWFGDKKGFVKYHQEMKIEYNLFDF